MCWLHFWNLVKTFYYSVPLHWLALSVSLFHSLSVWSLDWELIRNANSWAPCQSCRIRRSRSSLKIPVLQFEKLAQQRKWLRCWGEEGGGMVVNGGWTPEPPPAGFILSVAGQAARVKEKKAKSRAGFQESELPPDLARGSDGSCPQRWGCHEEAEPESSPNDGFSFGCRILKMTRLLIFHGCLHVSSN